MKHDPGGMAREPNLTRLSNVEPEKVQWLWPARIPFGKLTMLDGDPGVLKSTLALDLAARLSRNRSMPDDSKPETDGPRGTVLLTAEDGLADTVRPRLNAAGADASRVMALESVSTDEEEYLPTVQDLAAIRKAVMAVEAGLVVVDPLMAYLGPEVNSYRDQDVRAALAGLAGLADELKVAVLAIRHLNKGGGSNPKYRGGGSIGLIGAARSGLLVADDPEEPEGDRRVLATTKCNLAPEPPALAFRSRQVGSAVALSWEGETDHAAQELLERPSGEERSDREEAAHILREELRNGSKPVKELEALADQHGMSFKTFRRAKKRIGVESFREGYGKGGRWCWRLDGQEGCPPKADSEVSDNGNGSETQRGSGDGEAIGGQSTGVSTYRDKELYQRDLDDTLGGAS